jgi:hypothetical protein
MDCEPESPIDGWASYYPDGSTLFEDCQNYLQSELAPYISTPPVDPLSTGPYDTGYYYWYGSVNGGDGYVLLMRPETMTGTFGDGCYEYPPGFWYCIGSNWE